MRSPRRSKRPSIRLPLRSKRLSIRSPRRSNRSARLILPLASALSAKLSRRWLIQSPLASSRSSRRSPLASSLRSIRSPSRSQNSPAAKTGAAIPIVIATRPIVSDFFISKFLYFAIFLNSVDSGCANSLDAPEERWFTSPPRFLFPGEVRQKTLRVISRLARVCRSGRRPAGDAKLLDRMVKLTYRLLTEKYR
jgi:hypothetical protein